MSRTEAQKWGVGASIRRKEDDRLLRGRGRFIGDMQAAGQVEAAFLRSPVAHGEIRGLTVPEGLRDSVFQIDDMAGVRAIRSGMSVPGYQVSEQPVLAHRRVRFVGEPVAVCIAPTRAEAEDGVAALGLDVEDLPILADVEAALAEDAPALHDGWAGNRFAEIDIDGDLSAAEHDAAVAVRRRFRLARQCMMPLEGKGCLAEWDRQRGQLVLWTSTQMPHPVRAGLAECLNLPQSRIRVVAPDVGGGFGWKGLLQPEEVVIAWLAMHLDRPVKWLEDRREHLTAAANCREQSYEVTAYADRDGRLLGLDATVHVDNGAYSIYPFSAGLEASQISTLLPGPYDLPAYRARCIAVGTNKPPLAPYRGVGRPGACFATELMIDAVAHELGLDPCDVRLRNLVRPDQMPFRNIVGKHFDMGDYPESLRRARALIGDADIRARQAAGEADGRRIGIGYATFCEQGASGPQAYQALGLPMVPGAEFCQARLTPDGGLDIRIGGQSHGQSLETTLAQIASEVLGVDPANVDIVHGDTATSPYSTGTFGSRSAVMMGGAVAAACEALAEPLKRIGAHLLQAPEDAVAIAEGRIVAGTASISIAEVAAAFYSAPAGLPATLTAESLDLTAGYRPEADTGTFSYATHAAVVAVDTQTGIVEIVDYVVVEDGGVLINPMVVDGQIVGGTAQGIGTTLYEEVPFDRQGQPLASTLADYVLPGAAEVPDIRIAHMETPSPHTRFGQKGIGEGGAVAPPAAITNAVNDALRDLGVWIGETPITPHRLLSALARSEQEAGA